MPRQCVALAHHAAGGPEMAAMFSAKQLKGSCLVLGCMDVAPSDFPEVGRLIAPHRPHHPSTAHRAFLSCHCALEDPGLVHLATAKGSLIPRTLSTLLSSVLCPLPTQDVAFSFFKTLGTILQAHKSEQPYRPVTAVRGVREGVGGRVRDGGGVRGGGSRGL